MFAKTMILVELIGMTGLAKILFTLHQLHRLITAMAFMAKQTFIRRNLRVWLLNALAVILVAVVTGFGLSGKGDGFVGVIVEAGMTIHTAAFDIRLVGMDKGVGFWEIVVAGLAGLTLNLRRLIGRQMWIVAGTTLQICTPGMFRETDRSIHLVFVAGTTESGLRLLQHGRVPGAVGLMAEIALAVGAMRLRIAKRTILYLCMIRVAMAFHTECLWGCQQPRIRSRSEVGGCRIMAIMAIHSFCGKLPVPVAIPVAVLCWGRCTM